MPKPLMAALATLLIASMALACHGSSDNEEGGKVQESPKGPVPQAVLSIEGDAEDAIDMVFAGDWEQVAADAESITVSWSDFTASPEGERVSDEQRSAMDKAVAELADAAGTRDELATRQAANDVSKVIVDVFDLFDFNVPTDIGRLDWLERQIIIDTDRGDWLTVEIDLAQTREAFFRIRSDVETAGGQLEVDAFEASVGKQDRLAASRDAAIVDEANIALELVDDLESVY